MFKKGFFLFILTVVCIGIAVFFFTRSQTNPINRDRAIKSDIRSLGSQISQLQERSTEQLGSVKGIRETNERITGRIEIAKTQSSGARKKLESIVSGIGESKDNIEEARAILRGVQKRDSIKD